MCDPYLFFIFLLVSEETEKSWIYWNEEKKITIYNFLPSAILTRKLRQYARQSSLKRLFFSQRSRDLSSVLRAFGAFAAALPGRSRPATL